MHCWHWGTAHSFFFILQKKAVQFWIRAGLSGLFVIVGIGEIVLLHRWIWGSFLALTGVFLFLMTLARRKYGSFEFK
jgi:hypothetical protein